MTDMPPDEKPAPKSSDDLIREAREALGGNSATTSQASEDLVESATEWLGSNLPGTEDAATAGSGDSAASSLPSGREDTEALLESVPRRSPPRWQAPVPPGPLGRDGTGPQTRFALVMAVLVGIIALVGVAVALVAARSAGTDATPSTVTESSTGSITSASDPCSGADISGDLNAVITYLNDPDAPEVTVDIIGPELAGSDGSTYVLVIAGSATGSAGQQTFVFDSDSMTMTRSDGVVIEDVATITVEITGGRPNDWSYTSSGGECPF